MSTPHLVVSATPLYIVGITTLMTLIIIVSFCTTHNLVILLTCTKEETLGAHMNRANLVVLNYAAGGGYEWVCGVPTQPRHCSIFCALACS